MQGHTIADLAALSGLSVRTIRYYVAEGLVPPAGRDGKGARYPEATLARLRLIARLRDAHQPLAEIRRRLEALSDEEVGALLETSAPATPAGSALDYVRGLLGGASPADPPADPTSPRRAGVVPARRAEALARRLDLAAGPSFLRLAAPAAAFDAAPEADEVPGAPALPGSPGPGPARAAEPPIGMRSQWERIALSQDIELHVRRPLSRRDNRMVERLVAFARQLRGEDTP